jgi:hypothetical protein
MKKNRSKKSAFAQNQADFAKRYRRAWWNDTTRLVGWDAKESRFFGGRT